MTQAFYLWAVTKQRTNMPSVTKRNGSAEELIPEKIVVSVIKVGAPVDVARQIAKDVQNKLKEKATTAEIRQLVLEELRKRKPVWEQDWYVYERAVKKKKTQ